MKTIKSIDGKSLLIGGLLASTIFFAVGATGPTDKWDDEQVWSIKLIPPFQGGLTVCSAGYEPIAYNSRGDDSQVILRKRIK